MDLSEQEEIFMTNWIDAWDYAITRLQTGQQQLAQIALTRFRQGYHEFGSSVFLDENSDTLLKEIDEELADAIVYGAVMMWHTQKEDAAFVKET